jgi:hypothetical protein
METLEEELGLDDIEGAVDDIKDASKELATALTEDGGVIDTLEDELTAVSNVTGAWATQRQTVLDLIAYYEDLTGAIEDTIEAMSRVPDEEEEDDPPAEDPPAEDPPAEDPPAEDPPT